MSAPTVTWAQAIDKFPRRFPVDLNVSLKKVLETSEEEWLAPKDILHEVKRQNLKEICGSTPICSIKKVLYRSNGPYSWNKAKNVFALKSRINGEQLKTPVADNSKAKEHNTITNKEVETVNSEIATKDDNDKVVKDNSHTTASPGHYDPSCGGYIVTIDPDNDNLTESNCKMSSKFMPSPIRCAFPVRLLQSMPTKLGQSRSCKLSDHIVKPNGTASTAPLPVIEYDTLFDTTGDTCVAVLDKFKPRTVDPYEYSPSQSEGPARPHTPEESKDMESSRTRDGDEHDKNSKGLKKTPPSGSKLKRSAEKKRSLSEDSNLTSMNIRSLLTMENFVNLSKDNKQKVVCLLPAIDRCDEYTPTPSAFTNTFFKSACRQWQQLLHSGQLSVSQRAKQKLEGLRSKAIDEWKRQHFEEELSEDTPPQNPKSTLFYPVPLSTAHQRVLDCIKKVSEIGEDPANVSSPAAGVGDEVSDNLLEQENKPPVSESPEQFYRSHEQCNGSHELNGVLPESCHNKNDSQLSDGKVDDEVSFELNGDLFEKSNKPQSGDITEQALGTQHTPNNDSPNRDTTPPQELSVRNNTQPDKSCEQVDRSHDQKVDSSSCVSPSDKGKNLEQEGKVLSRSFEQDIEKASSLSLKLQINKLCQEELFRRLELFNNKSTDHQSSRSLEGTTRANQDKPYDPNKDPCSYTRKSRKQVKPYVKPPIKKTSQTSSSNFGGGKYGINMSLVNNNTPSLTNHHPQPTVSMSKKLPTQLTLCVPSRFQNVGKRKSPITIPHSKKKLCDNNRSEFLAVLPPVCIYSDILDELKRRSTMNSVNNNYTLPSHTRKQSLAHWQSLHSIYHDHSYAADYVPLSSVIVQDQMTAVCDDCVGEPLLICENCKRCVHNWCLVSGCSPYCKDCLCVF